MMRFGPKYRALEAENASLRLRVKQLTELLDEVYVRDMARDHDEDLHDDIGRAVKKTVDIPNSDYDNWYHDREKR